MASGDRKLLHLEERRHYKFHCHSGLVVELDWLFILFVSITMTSYKHQCDPNHHQLDRLFSGVFRLTPKKTSTRCIAGLCMGNLRWPADAPQNRPVMRKTFDVMTSSRRPKCAAATRRRHNMGTFAALLALCEGNPLITGGFPSQSSSHALLWYYLWCKPRH